MDDDQAAAVVVAEWLGIRGLWTIASAPDAVGPSSAAATNPTEETVATILRQTIAHPALIVSPAPMQAKRTQV
ncbi:hypothetical protein GCM10023087_21710 [Microbacterium rhizosphaerae]